MEYRSESGDFDFSQAVIKCAAVTERCMTWEICGAAAENASIHKKCTIPHLLISFSDFSFEKIICAGRRFLKDGKVYGTGAHTLYRSEIPDFEKSLCSFEGILFSLEKKGDVITAELCIENGSCAIYTVLIRGGFSARWEAFGEPAANKKRSLAQWAQELTALVPAAAFAIGHKDTPGLAKLLCAAAVGYALSPIDLIPDFIPVIGHLDDLIIVPVLICMGLRLIPPHVMEECREKARYMQNFEKHKKWYYGIPVIIIWLIIIGLIAGAVIF